MMKDDVYEYPSVNLYTHDKVINQNYSDQTAVVLLSRSAAVDTAALLGDV